jgi:hypothetical protein
MVEAGAAQNRSALAGKEWDGCTDTTPRAIYLFLGTCFLAFRVRFALLAMFRIIDELLVFKEDLLPDSEREFFPTGNTNQFSVCGEIMQNAPGQARLARRTVVAWAPARTLGKAYLFAP